MKNISTDELDTFIEFVDNECNGNLYDARVAEKYSPMHLVYKTAVDQSKNPFSDEYYQSQLALYEEVAGRRLDQWSGELHLLEKMDPIINSHNPQSIHDGNQVSENIFVL